MFVTLTAVSPYLQRAVPTLRAVAPFGEQMITDANNRKAETKAAYSASNQGSPGWAVVCIRQPLIDLGSEVQHVPSHVTTSICSCAIHRTSPALSADLPR
jgi:hypothetical protein